MNPIHELPEQHWECPNCTTTAITRGAPNRFHTCPGLKGLTAPMVPAGARCEVRAVEREDYVGTDDVRLDGDGRPVMAVVTTREDGQDVVAFAPTATGSGGA